MGNQIIKQPDGHFAIFNSNTNTIIVWDAEADEVVERFASWAAEAAREDARRLLGHVAADEPEKAYYQFAMTWDEALEEDREHGGEVWRHFERTEPAEDAT